MKSLKRDTYYQADLYFYFNFLLSVSVQLGFSAQPLIWKIIESIRIYVTVKCPKCIIFHFIFGDKCKVSSIVINSKTTTAESTVLKENISS